MGLCLTATMTSCDDDEDNGVSVPQEVLSAMPGTYVNSMEYGEATADSAMTVTLGTADMQFNLPVSNIIKDVVAAENLEQALNYNPQNEMFWHFRTKCSFSKTKRTS